MAELETGRLQKYIYDIVDQKGFTISEPIEKARKKVYEDEVVIYAIYVYLDKAVIGSISYSFETNTITETNLRKQRTRDHDERVVYIIGLDVSVFHRGKNIATLLLGAAFSHGLENGIMYSKLDDMSDAQNELYKNIYRKLGFTNQDVPDIHESSIKGGPERQLYFISEDHLVRVFKHQFVKKHTFKLHRTKRKTKVHVTRKSQPRISPIQLRSHKRSTRTLRRNVKSYPHW